VLGDWVFDWRTGLTLLASLVVALVLAVVITGARTTNDALEARNRTASAATRRIDMLNEKIDRLGAELAVANENAVDNGNRIGQLDAQIGALQEQVRALGGRPVVPTTTTTTRPPSTTTTTRPTTTTTTTPQRCVLVLCVAR
jgi:hypothetical protein